MGAPDIVGIFVIAFLFLAIAAQLLRTVNRRSGLRALFAGSQPPLPK